MPSHQYILKRLLLLSVVALVLPAYRLLSGESIWILRGVLFGSLLFIWKCRWWWDPLSKYAQPGADTVNNENEAR